jgi:hypothetical protein
LRLAWDYFRAGGDDPEVSCLLIEKGLVDPVREMERFTAFGGFSRAGLLRKIAAALRVRYPKLLEEALASFTGTAVLDKDADGIPEERFRLEKGRLLGWDTDEDQDGLDELTVEFQEAEDTFLPARVIYRTGGAVMDCLYAGYPYVSEAVYSEGERTFSHSLLPGSLALPIVRGFAPGAGTSWLDYHLDEAWRELPREKIEALSYMYEERNAREPDYRRLVFLTGGRVRQMDFTYGGVVFHRVFFDGGRFSYGLRDLDRDGVFDTREFYEDGKLAALRADTTGDGKEDYAETFFPDIIKEWDIDGDGVIDAREALRGGGEPGRYYKDFGGIK